MQYNFNAAVSFYFQIVSILKIRFILGFLMWITRFICGKKTIFFLDAIGAQEYIGKR